MSTGKKVFYILFLIVTLSVGAGLALWGVYQIKALLFVSIGLFALFTAMFAGMLIVNRKTGWRGEKTLSFRLSREALFCDLYILKAGKKRYTIDLYPAGDPERYLSLLKLAEENDGDAIAELGEECLGQMTISSEKLGALRGKTVATSPVIHAALGSNPALKEFLVKNTFLYY